MALNYDDACDAILGVLKATWDTDTPALVGGSDPAVLLYEDTERDLAPQSRDTDVPWARVVIRHATGSAAALGNHRFRRTGTVWVQCFAPNKDGLAKTLASALARVAQKSYESTRGSAVSFKDVSVAEKGPDGSFYRVDCTASFWWDEIR